MNELLAHSHLLDGTLGRAAAYMAVGLLIGLSLWTRLQVKVYPLKPWIITVMLLGYIGAIMVLHGILAEQADPFINPTSMSNAPISWQQVGDLLFHTSTGRSWLLFLLLLSISCLRWLSYSAATRSVQQYAWDYGLLAGLVMSLALTAHAGETGMLNALYWLDVVHMGLALAWLGSMMLLAISRLAGQMLFTWQHLLAYSRLALPLFIGMVVTGVCRLWWQYAQNDALAWVYLGVLLIKLLAIVGVVAAAAQLRRLLRQTKPDGHAYDHYLTYEVFCALLLILATTLLTQLPSW